MKYFFFILVLLSVFYIGRKTASPTPQTDTVTITKTITERVPVPDTIYLTKWERIPIHTRDTIILTEQVPQIVHDTIYVPISTSYYERADGRLRLWISGYNTSLDKWELDEQTKIVTKRKKWGFSVGLGPAVIYSPFHNNIDAGIGAFCGVTYTF